MFADAVACIAGSVFPIFQAVKHGDSFDINVTGTGFFVDRSGFFLTVEHVMSAVPGATMLYYGNVPDRVCEPAEIECVAADPERDLFLGRMPRESLPPVELATAPARTGDSVCFGGYPMAALSTNPQGGVVGNVRRYWEATFVVDSADLVLERRTYNGYILQHACLRGMCGGPVFDASGKVRGMAAATLTRTVADTGYSPTVLQNGVVLDVKHLRHFIEQHVGDVKVH